MSRGDEAVYREELDEVAGENPNFSYQIWPSEDRGYLSADDLSVDDYEDKAYLICGPANLKRNLTRQLIAKGVSKSAIYDEEFAFR